jgi:predicted GIY-YIG superfamily endonuclease
MFLYVLKLADNKWYIGKTKDPDHRILQHVEGYGSAWTKKYKPIEIIEIIELKDNFEEDLLTKRYMAKYGIENVRGGTYCTIYLDGDTIKFLQREIIGASDLCFICKKSGHFAKECPYRDCCERCGRDHSTENCYATYDINGDEISDSSDEEMCERCGRDHSTEKCYATYDINGVLLKKVKDNICNIQ